MESVLENGTLKVRPGAGAEIEQAYTIGLLDESDLPSIVALQNIIVSNLKSRDMLQPFSSEFLKEHLGKRGFILGVFSEGNLVAFRNVYFPDSQDPKWNLGRDIGLQESELNKVANLQLVCVLPEYRGNSLAMKMNRHSLLMLDELASYDHICATVSPMNIWNLQILLNCGFHIKNLKLKYSGKIRYIVYQRLKEPVSFHKDTVAAVSLNDLGAQKILFREGLCGVKLKPAGKFDQGSKHMTANQWELVFQEPVEEPKIYVVPRRPARHTEIKKTRQPGDFGNLKIPRPNNDTLDRDKKK